VAKLSEGRISKSAEEPAIKPRHSFRPESDRSPAPGRIRERGLRPGRNLNVGNILIGFGPEKVESGFPRGSFPFFDSGSSVAWRKWFWAPRGEHLQRRRPAEREHWRFDWPKFRGPSCFWRRAGRPALERQRPDKSQSSPAVGRPRPECVPNVGNRGQSPPRPVVRRFFGWPGTGLGHLPRRQPNRHSGDSWQLFATWRPAGSFLLSDNRPRHFSRSPVGSLVCFISYICSIFFWPNSWGVFSEWARPGRENFFFFGCGPGFRCLRIDPPYCRLSASPFLGPSGSFVPAFRRVARVPRWPRGPGPRVRLLRFSG